MDKQPHLFIQPDYKRSRRAYTLECAFEYFVALLVGNSFLAKLLGSIGMSDALIGIISSFISLSFIFQLFSIFAVRRITNTKRFVTVFHTASNLLVMSLYLIPFLPFEYKHKEIIVILCILVAYFGNYFVTSVIYQWGNSYVYPHHRGRFSATKEMISLASGMAVTLVLGYVMDAFEANGDLHGGFLFAAISIFVFSAADLICLLLIKNRVKTAEEKKEKTPMSEVFKNTLGNKNFLAVILVQVLWDVGRYITVGFMGTYQINPTELAFSLGAVQLINIIGNAVRFFVSRPFGKYSDKYSYAKGIELGFLIAIASFLVCAFLTPTTRYLLIPYVILNCACYAGISQNMLNITYSYVDSKYVAEAMAIKNCIGGVCGFAASLLASKLLSAVQNSGNSFLGLHVYGQQILGAISCVVLIVAVLVVRFVVEKQKRMIQ